MADEHEMHNERVERVEQGETLSGGVEPNPGAAIAAGGRDADDAADDRSTMSPKQLPSDDIEARSRLAISIDQSAFPANREALLESARRNDAPGSVKERLAAIPDREYRNVQEVWEAMGGSGEPPH